MYSVYINLFQYPIELVIFVNRTMKREREKKITRRYINHIFAYVCVMKGLVLNNWSIACTDKVWINLGYRKLEGGGVNYSGSGHSMLCLFFFFSSKQIKLIFNHLLSFVRFRTKRKILVICSSYFTVNTLFNEKIQLYSILILSIYAFNLECIYLAMSAIQNLQCVTFQFGFYLRY